MGPQSEIPGFDPRLDAVDHGGGYYPVLDDATVRAEWGAVQDGLRTGNECQPDTNGAAAGLPIILDKRSVQADESAAQVDETAAQLLAAFDEKYPPTGDHSWGKSGW